MTIPDDIQAAIVAYRAEIEQLDESERAPARQHLDAAEQHLEAAGHWVAIHAQRREHEAEAARQQADRQAAEQEGAEHDAQG